jgi:hypothetical protein
MHPCNSDVATRHPGLSPGVRDALADPIVQALLAADRVDPQEVADLARRVAARLSGANPRGKREPLSTGPIRMFRSELIPGAMEVNPWRNRLKR